jgi:hypothetical protein
MLPTFNNLTTPLIGLLLILALTDFKSLKVYFSKQKLNIIVLGLPLIFVMSCISLMYSDDLDKGLKYSIRLLPLLAFPIILSKVGELKKEQIRTIYRFFILGCILCVVYSFAYVFYEVFDGAYKKVHQTQDHFKYFLNRITYHDLVSKNRVDHSIYFGAYVLLAISLLKTVQKPLFSKNINSIILGILIVTLMLLTPVVIAISGGLVFSFYVLLKKRDHITVEDRKNMLKTNVFWGFLILYLIIWKVEPHEEYLYVFNNLKYNAALIIGIIGLVVLGQLSLSVYNFKRLRAILVFVFIAFFSVILFFCLSDISIETMRLSNFTARLYNYYSSMEVLKENFFFGVGLGDVQSHLVEVYRSLRFRKIEFNEHNQYLRFWLSSGIITCLLFVWWMIKTVLQSVKFRNIPMITVALTMCVFCFTETVLIRQMGISFFIFFILFFNESNKLDTTF